LAANHTHEGGGQYSTTGESLPQTKARARIFWTRESSDERIKILKKLSLEKEPYWAQPWDKLPPHYKEAIAIHYSATEHPQTEEQVTPKDLDFAEAMWESTKQLVEEGDPYGIHIWRMLEHFYPGNKTKQVSTLGFMNEVYGRYGKGPIPHEELLKSAKKWDVGKMLAEEMLKFLPQFQPGIWKAPKKVCRTPEGSVLELVQVEETGWAFPGTAEIIEHKDGQKKSWGVYTIDKAMRIAKQFCGVYPEGDLFTQTKKRWVTIDNPGDSSFQKDAFVPYEEFEAEREKILQRKGKPPSIKVRIEEPPGNGAKELLETVQGKPLEHLTKLEKPLLPKFRETFGLVRKDKMGTIQSISPKYNTQMFDYFADTDNETLNVFVWNKGSFPAFEYFMKNAIADWSRKRDVPEVDFIITDYNGDIFYSIDNQIVIPVKLVRAFKEEDKEFRGLLYFIAHEFCHWVAEQKKLAFPEPLDEERFANKTAEELTGIMWEDALISLHNLLPEVWERAIGNRSLEEAIEKVKAAKSKGNYLAKTKKAGTEILSVARSSEGKLLPALKPYDPYRFAYYVLENNTFTEDEIPYYSGLTGANPHGVPDAIWAKALADMEGQFVKVGDLYTISTPGIEEPPHMRAAPTWRDVASTVPIRDVSQWAKNMDMITPQVKFGGSNIWRDSNIYGGIQKLIKVLKPGDTVFIKKVTLETTLFYSVENVNGKIEVTDRSFPSEEPKVPAAVPTQPPPPNPKEELEFVSDSPEFLAYTIEDIGYRDKLDKAFERAIARAKGK